jgi:type III pantothenate kinase
MSLRILAVDCGNTRLKWGLHADGAWQETGAALLGALEALAARWSELPAPDKIVVSNVAGDAMRIRLQQLLAHWPVESQWVEAQPAACGVINRYAEPKQLGSDRWAALIGARALHTGACLVVTAGTATTADMLLADGSFTGGLIYPGLDLMKRSLSQNTARLPLARGRYDDEPRNTDDAIETGCLLAQAAPLDRLFSRLGTGAVCVLSGGAAPAIAPHLRIPVRLVDNLILEGLLRLTA